LPDSFLSHLESVHNAFFVPAVIYWRIFKNVVLLGLVVYVLVYACHRGYCNYGSWDRIPPENKRKHARID
jgi:hypothetical protein